MQRRGPFRALDHTFTIRAPRALAERIETEFAGLRSDDTPHDTLTLRRSRSRWSLFWTDASVAERVDDDEVLAETLLAVDLAAASSAARTDAVLHGGTVSIDGRGVTFLGPTEPGTPSIAVPAALAGHGFVADVVTAVGPDGWVRAYHRAVTAGAVSTLDDGVALAAVCILRSHDEAVAQLEPADALVELSHHAAAIAGFDTTMFRRFEEIARAVPVHVVPHHTPSEMMAIVSSLLC